ncbi:MAG: hypothetical protein PVG86_09635, partial [Desulfobacterales bacterium]
MKTIRIVGVCMVVLLISTSLSNAVTTEANKNVERLKKLGQVCLKYMKDHNGQMPPTLSELYNQAYIKDLSLFSSPSKPIGILERSEIDEKSDYVLCSEKEPIIPEKPYLMVMKMPYDQFRPIIRDRSEDNNPKTKKIFVFFDDRTVYPLRPVIPTEDESKDDQKTYQLSKKTGDTDVEVVRDFFLGLPLHIVIESRSGATGILTSKKAFELQPGKYRIQFRLVGDPSEVPRRVHLNMGDIYDDEVTLGTDEMVRAY